MSRPFVVLGYAAPEAHSKSQRRMSMLAARLAEIGGVDVSVTPLSSYDRVAQLIHHREIDLAWLSPIPLIALARNRRVVPMLSLHRDQQLHYRCALIVSSSCHMTTFEELRGKRAAWVDRQSASGYVLPRIELAVHEIGPRNLAGERFFGSHGGVVRAVASGRADFGATFARVAAGGGVTGVTGPWSQTPLARSIRVVTTFGDVPADAIAARADLDRGVRERVTHALRAMTKGASDRELLATAFGVHEFRVPRRSMYDALRKTVYEAFCDGLLESDATTDEAILGVAATIEHRRVVIAPEPPTMRKLPRGPTKTPDDTQEDGEVVS